MTFRKLAPILTTEDMDRSVRFYVDVLGFTCGMQTPGYSNLYRDAVRIMLGAPNAHGEWKGPKLTGQLYIGLKTAEEVDALWAKVKDRTEVVYPVDDFDYGMHEFGIRDDSGYSLERYPFGLNRGGIPESRIE
jgi:catechol 2,3-dioxygenase-like lactoylglutathione lyase family enzyme